MATSELTGGDGPGVLAHGDLAEDRRQLYRKLGWCMIRLQQVELGMKWLAEHTEIRSSADELTEQIGSRAARISRQTLGLVTEAVSLGILRSLDWEPANNTDADESPVATIRMGLSIGPEDDHLESVRSRLKEFVARRNLLIHGLISHYDIWTAEGCASAISYVDETLVLADTVLTEIRRWTSSIADDLAWLASPEPQELVHGVTQGLDE